MFIYHGDSHGHSMSLNLKVVVSESVSQSPPPPLPRCGDDIIYEQPLNESVSS